MQKSKKRKVVEAVLLIFAALLVTVIGYLIYVFATFNRLDDHINIEITEPDRPAGKSLEINKTYKITTYNIGFGAYSPDFSFFMDGGKESVAKSEDSVKELTTGAAELIKSMNADITLFQEVDTDSTRSRHVNQLEMLNETFPEYYGAYAVNYHSAFLFYPFLQPIGKSNSGILTLSSFAMTSSERRKLPIAESVKKILDLDRCFTVSRISAANGKELVIINLHTSAYGTDDKVRDGQISLLCEVLEEEYNKGNYVICGGDFNHDLLADENDKSDKASWAYPFPKSKLPKGFEFAFTGLDSVGINKMWNSGRNTDMPFVEGETYTIMLDGFIISDNVKMVTYDTYKTGYKYSDHEPVVMEFRLIGE